MSARNPSLVQAFRATRYVILLAPEIVMVPGERSAALARLHADLGVQCSGFVTAWNPQAHRHELHDNDVAQARLAQALAAGGWRTRPAVHRAPQGDWDESSFWVPGIDRAALGALGREFGQLAVLHAGSNATPQLCWLD